MIIDAHTHIMPQRRLDGLSIWLGRVFTRHPLAGQPISMDSVLEELCRNGVKCLFNCVFPIKPNETEELNLFNFHLNKRFKNIIPFGSLHIENKDKKAIVDRCVHEYKFPGFKLHPYVQGFYPADERLFPAYERMEELGAPIYIHTGFEEYYPNIEKVITLSAIEGLIKRFSSLMFIIPHMFYPRLDEGLYLLDNYENLHVDTTNIFSAILQDEEKGLKMNNVRDIFMKTLHKWSQRMVFGSDYPAGMGDAHTIFSDFYLFDLDNGIKQDLLYRTAREFLKRHGNLDVDSIVSAACNREDPGDGGD